MTQLERIYHEALVQIIARRHLKAFQSFDPPTPADVLPREAFTTDEAWQKWTGEAGPDVISRAHELVNEGHISYSHPMDYICPKCSHRSATQDEMDWHMRYVHFDGTPIPDEDFKSE